MLSKRKKNVGLPPGAVVFTGQQKVEQVRIHYLQYTNDTCREDELDMEKRLAFPDSPDDMVDWYDVRGLHDGAVIERIGKTYAIHPLVLEDIPDVHGRPRFEEFAEGLFVTIKALSFDDATDRIHQEHVAIYLKAGLVLSFQETDSDLFAEVRRRINEGYGRIRRKGGDYLTYALLDAVTDNYFVVLEAVEDRIEALEERLLDNPDSGDKTRIHHLKKQLLLTRKSIAPLREAVSRFYKSESPLIDETTTIFLRDLYDHTIQIMDLVESYRDALNSLQDLFVSEVSLRMNQVMQVLTIISALFIPLTFLAGIYGMNFDHIPELHYQHGYYILLGVMLLITLALLWLFRRRQWL